MSGFNLNVGGFNVGSGAGGAAASTGCGGGCGAIFGIILGIVLIPVGFYLAYHAEEKLVDHGRIFEGITMSQPDTARGMEGEMVKIQGQAQGDFLTIEEWDGKALYYRKLIEEYEEERDSEGDVTYDWETANSESDWVDSFNIDEVTVRPEGANAVGEEEVYSAYKKKFETAFHEGTDPSNPEVGDQRKSVEVLDATKTVIVVGQMASGAIQGGESFVVSTQNEQQTMQTLKTEYKMAKWGMRAGAVFAIFFGIMMIFGPLTTLVGYVPIVGDSLSCAFAGIAFVVALVSVTIVTVFIKAFWFLVAIVVLGVAFMIYRGIKTPRQGPGGGGEAPEQPVPPMQPTPPTTGASQAGTSTTLPPGAGAGVPRPSAPPEGTQPAEDVGPAPPAAPPAEREAGPDLPGPVGPSEKPSVSERAAGSAFMRPAEPSEATPPETAAQIPTPEPPMEEQPDVSEAPIGCSACGAELEPGSKFCQACGAKAEEASSGPDLAASPFLRPAEPSEARPPDTAAQIPTPEPPMEEQPDAEAAPKYCANCGVELEAGSKFCQECGAKAG